MHFQTSQQSTRVQRPSSTEQHSTTSHSAFQATIKTEAVHKTIHTHAHAQSSETRSVSHDVSVQHQTANNQNQDSTEKEGDERHGKKTDPNVWSVLNSVDDGSSMMFGLPAERSTKEKQADSLQLVMDLIDKVNAQQSDFATADSKALRKVHAELTKVSQLVRNFLEYSTNLINDEGTGN